MRLSQITIRSSMRVAALLLICADALWAQTATGLLRGQITDELGGVIVEAVVSVTNAKGVERTVTTNDQGVFEFNRLSPGIYALKVAAKGFASYEKDSVNIVAGQPQSLNIKLTVAVAEQQVNVSDNSRLTTDPDNNGGALVFRGKELDILPDDPGELAAALKALVGPSAGPNGGQIYIDGFTGANQLPPKQSIREIRINQNPFSAEYDQMGFGRIEITTKPGAGTLHGSWVTYFNNEKLNSRNPFVANRPPYQFRVFGLTLTGPLATSRASYFLSLYRRAINDSSIIHAVVLDSAFNVAPLNQAVIAPKRFTEIYPRFDFKLNNNHNLMIRASLAASDLKNSGVGDFSLLSRAYETSSSDKVLQLTETATLNAKTANEFRLQYIHSSREQIGNDSTPTIRVLDSFTGGGAQVGAALNHVQRWELHNVTTRLSGLHILKMGGRLRTVQIQDSSRSNFAGTYIFTGGPAPQLDDNGSVSDSSGQSTPIEINSLERYRRTVLFSQQGMLPAEIRALGGGASQLTIVTGNTAARASQFDAGVFILDDWRLRPDFTLSLGLRYETQNNISSKLDFAPRIAFAWAPGTTKSRQAKMVIRGGMGIFYDRFNEGYSLITNRFDGTKEKQYVITDAALLDLFPQVPSNEVLSGLDGQQIVWRTAENLTAPYTIQTAISVERQLPYKLMLTTTYINSRGLHYLRARNINAPLPGAIASGATGPGTRPFGETGNIFEFESSGILKQHQFIINAMDRYSPTLTFFATYVLGSAKSDTDGASSFPAYTYDLRREYGRAAFDVRHRLIGGALINLRWGVNLTSFIIASSGAPFNITTGTDLNGDTLFTDRPAFANDLSRSSVRITRFGAFDINPAPGQEPIPHNYGEGPGYFSTSLRLSKTFQLNNRMKAAHTKSSVSQAGAGAKTNSGPSGAWRERPYSLNISVSASNLLNHTNASAPVGNLNSPLFGRSNTITSTGLSLGGGNQAAFNRRIDLQVQFNF